MDADDDLSEPLYRVVCAAIRHPETGTVICGARHYDEVMRKVIRAMCGSAEAAREEGWYSCDQGFINNKGEFMTRGQAWEIAAKGGQIRRQTGPLGTLFSEDLY